MGQWTAPLIKAMDTRLLRRIRAMANSAMAISPYVQEVFLARGIPTDGLVYGFPDLATFQPSSGDRTRDYVLLYSGKETSRLDWHRLHEAGVRIVAFGGKPVAGGKLNDGLGAIERLGQVSDADLRRLYTNALFTMVPFSYEALGFVPIESMACGTPVLTYGRQGPAFTVVDGVTGWLCRSSREMEDKAIELWAGRSTGIAPDICRRRAAEFEFDPHARRLIGRLLE